MVTKVAAHEDEGVWVGGCARKSGEVTDVVAWRIQEVKGAISEEVIGPEGTGIQWQALF